MPSPMTMEMNITEKIVRCPTVSVMMPMDQASVTASTASIRSGLPTRQHVGEGRLEIRDDAADDLDGPAVAHEAALVVLGRLDEDEEQALVVRQEVAGVGRVVFQGKERAPRRVVRRRAVEAPGDLVEHEAEESRVLAAVLAEAQVEHVRHESRGHTRVGAFDQPRQARVAGEALHELLVVEDLLPDLLELVDREV